MSSHPVLHFYQVPSKYFKGYSSYRADTNSISNKIKSKKARVVILVCNTSRPVLHFYQVPSKYSKGYSSYRADTNSISNKIKSKKARVVILVCNTSRPVLHFYQVPSKYSKGYSSYRADKKFYFYANAEGICPEGNMPLPLVGGDIMISGRHVITNPHISVLTQPATSIPGKHSLPTLNHPWTFFFCEFEKYSKKKKVYDFDPISNVRKRVILTPMIVFARERIRTGVNRSFKGDSNNVA